MTPVSFVPGARCLRKTAHAAQDVALSVMGSKLLIKMAQESAIYIPL